MKRSGEIMHRYSCVIFDMDGTLVDSYPGIFNAYRHALEGLGEAFPGDRLVRRAIGAPLPLVFEEMCGLDADRTRQAVALFRAYYAEKGMHEAQAYPGMGEALQRLKGAGCFLGTATLKKEAFARAMLEECGLLPYFDAVCGTDERDSFTKAALIHRCCLSAGAAKADTVLVGDSSYDAEGAREAGVAFLAVTYGFGFPTPDSLAVHGVSMAAASPEEAADRLLEGR